MAIWPPSVDVEDDTTMKAMADVFRSGTNAGSNFLDFLIRQLKQDIIDSMQDNGLDGANRFGFGSDAKKAADAVCNPLNKAKGHLEDAGKLVGFAYMAFMKDVWNPIQVAKAARNRGRRGLKV